ncbi:precorrin-2 dehydrogenase/sirohydrochlorin ferrochelatase family protein [Persephonella sp.]
MALFPLFINLAEKKILIVGAGNVALRKIEKLIPFTKNIKVVAKETLKEVEELCKREKIELIKKEFSLEDLNGIDIAIVAVDNIELQKMIFNFCRSKGILVNSVDSPDYCDFIFPAYVKRGDIVIGITTSGKAPGLSGKLREIIEKNLPPNIENLLEELSEIRKKEEKGERRQKLIMDIINKKLK